MIFKKIQFDRKTFLTSQSRSIRISHKLNLQEDTKIQSGFTLIELLVVISIVALLSTVILGALGDSRVKARNTAKNNLVLEYVKALELYRSDNGTYPIPTETSNPICFGYATNESCYAEAYNGSDSIITKLSSYLPGNFAHKGKVPYLSYNLDGVQYQCIETNCSSYQLIWFNEKNNQKCITDARIENPFSGSTQCTYSKK